MLLSPFYRAVLQDRLPERVEPGFFVSVLGKGESFTKPWGSHPPSSSCP